MNVNVFNNIECCSPLYVRDAFLFKTCAFIQSFVNQHSAGGDKFHKMHGYSSLNIIIH